MSNTPNIRFKGFTDDWEQRKLGDITELKSASRVHKKEWTTSGVPFYRSSDVMSAINGTKNEKAFISEELYEKLSDVSGKLEAGDVLVTGGGSVGNPYIVPNNEPLYTKDADLLWIKNQGKFYPYFLYEFFFSPTFRNYLASISHVGTIAHYTITQLSETPICLPNFEEQKKVGEYFQSLDHLITLHRRAHFHPTKEDLQMTTTTGKDNLLFCDYYKQWITVYKEGAIRPVTMSKYLMAHKWVEKLVPELSIKDLDRFSYQKLLNDYAAEHERQTTMDFHHHLKCAILDAVDEGLIPSDPTRKAIIKGKPSRNKKPKYLNQYELHKLLDDLNLDPEVNLDWMILLIAKTGMRFSEALGLTPKDFDLSRQIVSVTKTWDYKTNCGFQPTKNQSSIRKIPLDWQTVMQFAQLIKSLPEDEPIFVKGKIYNSTVNERLARHCKRVDIPIISIHGLRHTHASLLLFAGVSIASVARRLGHSNMTTTQKTYLHIIQELESKDIDIIMRSLSNLNS